MENKVLAKVNGKDITQFDVDQFLSSLGPERSAQFNNDEGKKKLLEELINQNLYLVDAIDSKIEETAEFQNEMARMKDVITRTAAISGLVLPSFEDEQVTFNDKTPMETAQRYQALGVKQIVVKNAESDTLFVEGERIEYFPVKHADGVIDTTAAGDSFNGAYFAEYMNSGDISKSITLAQKCAATVICEKGALIPFETVQASI